MKKNKTKILFLCTGNSCRSQMAEGWARHYKSDDIQAMSAGVMAKGLDPLAVLVMKEVGVDISRQKSKKIQQYEDVDFDFVVTVCGHARETCPWFPGKAKIVHRGFDDPPKLARTANNQKEALRHYRRVRDEIEAFVRELPSNLE